MTQVKKNKEVNQHNFKNFLSKDIILKVG